MWQAIATTFIVAVALGGCERRAVRPAARTAGPSLGSAVDSNRHLEGLVREHIEATLVGSPVLATWLGSHSYDGRLDDLSAEAQAREMGRLRTLGTRLEGIASATLDRNHQVERQLLDHEITAALYELGEVRPLERSPVRYLEIASAGISDLLVRDFAPLPERVRSVSARLLRLHALFDEARRNLKNPPELGTRRAVELAQGMRSFLSDTLAKTVVTVGDEKLVAEFRTAQTESLRALDDFIAWLQKELLPRSKGELAVGAQRLRERMRVVDGIDLSIEPLLETAMAELGRTRQQLEEVAKGVAPGKSWSEALRLVEDDHPTEGELFAFAAEALGRAAEEIRRGRWVTRLPGAPKIQEMPPFLWGFLTLSQPGPLETKSHEAIFYLEPVDRGWTRRQREEHLRTLNRSALRLALLHEVFPGHLLQGEAARAAATPLERWSHNYLFIEGWAEYAVTELIAGGLGERDPKLRLAQLREELTHICRLLAVLKLHAGGAKLEEIAKFFAEEGGLDDYSARREAERVALDPMVLAPQLGRLEILKLREEEQRTLGDRFSWTEFHDRLLAEGAIPLSIIRENQFGHSLQK